MANGTTLGADNGIAVATNLAIMEDNSLEHGPLEFLFTIDEETGLTGAYNLAPGLPEGPTLINLDSEEEGAVYVGCSGGRDTTGVMEGGVHGKPRRRNRGAADRAGQGAPQGGHSGLEIDKGRGNAIKILNRVILALRRRRAPSCPSTAGTSATPSRARRRPWSASRRPSAPPR